MPTTCCVPTCKKRSGRDLAIRFYSIPRMPESRYESFLMAINRIKVDGTKWLPSDSTRICSNHFVGARKSEDPSDLNYLPTIRLPPRPSVKDGSRRERFECSTPIQSPAVVKIAKLSLPDLPTFHLDSFNSTYAFSGKVTRRTADIPPDKMIPIIQLNPHITCPLCTGYLIQPCTITECNHTYCKSCIINHIGFSLQCPVCDINIHPTDPLSNIRRDYQKEGIILKLLPKLEAEENKREHAFYRERGLPYPVHGSGASRKSKRRVLSERMVSLVLEFAGSTSHRVEYKPLDKKFVRVSARITINQIQTFIRKKTGLPPDCEIGIFIDTSLIHEKASLQQLIDTIPDLEEEDGMIALHYGILDSSVTSLFDSL